ncbi:TolC family protein [Cryomorpha ignava]|uniref:TolC family protein n=2 Tax=Cryomorpha ignava TaxID=101383 RepID=A0A7K3WQ85_9FLAO|nr:TolC family protein [Cryomorpha ignava]
MTLKGFLFALTVFFSAQLSAQTLEDYYRIAAEDNPGLKAKYTDFEASLERVVQVNSLPDPTFSFGYFLSPVETRVGPQRAKFSLSQMFPWFGTLSARGDVATLNAEAKYQAFLDARNALYYQVSAIYYPLYELRELQEIEVGNIRILESFKTIATSKFENGSGSLADALRADITLQDAIVELAILQEKENGMHAAFNKLLNRPYNAAIEISDTLTVQNAPIVFQPDSILSRNPSLASLSLQAQAAEAQQIAAQKQGLPAFGVGIDYVLVDKRTDMDMPKNGQNVLMPMVTMSIPIFRGKYKGAIREAELLQESFELKKQDYSNSLLSSFHKVQFDLKKQTDLIALYRRQVVTTQQTMNLLLSAYANSGNDFEDVLNIQKQLLKYQRTLVNALVQYNISFAEMDYIMSRNN